MKSLTIDLPTPEEFTDGLDPHTLNPRLSDAETALQDAEKDRVAAKDRVGELTRGVDLLPGRIREGGASPGDLTRALDEQRAAALQLPQFEQTVTEAREQVRAEQQRAGTLLREEVGRRLAVLQEVVERLSPVLSVVRDLELELGHVLDKRNLGLGLEWPRCWKDEGERRGMSNIISQFNLETAGFKSYADAAWNRKATS